MNSPKIIFQDKSVLIINKPAGWIVNDADTTGNQPVIQKWLTDSFDYSLAKNREERSGIVHRLDKETSGVLLVGKTKEIFKNLQSQFKERKVQKTYIALVHGKVEPKEGEVKAPVGRLPWRRDRFGIVPGGREASTEYKVVGYYQLEANTYTLLELYPKTGRTHQIRIHLKYLDHPVVADSFYAGRKTAREDRKWCPRLFLHARKVSFVHPSDNNRVVYEAELPKDLNDALKALHSAKSSLN